MATALDLDWIDERLAVGGSFPMEAAEQLARREDIRAVVDLRIERCDDEAILRLHGLEFLHLPTEDCCAIAPRMIDDGVAFARGHLDAGRRVLIHCEHGIGRSALLALCILVAGGVGPLDAMNRLKAARPVASPAPEQLEAFRTWVGRWKQRTGARWEVPSVDALAWVAYAHLRTDGMSQSR
ncbi:MAG TPA: dual specificity protein phosphatase family protein [Myxococcaceae bacterium]|nr:dual specificity protein phosphatase family protein [Myxococcaceae bacterium]